MHIGEFDQLFDDIVMASLSSIVEHPHLIRSGEDFASSTEACKHELISTAQKISVQVLDILSKRQQVVITLEQHAGRIEQSVKEDVQSQLDALVYDGFVRTTPHVWRAELHRYLQAMTLRVRRLVEHGKEPVPGAEFEAHLRKYSSMTSEQLDVVPDYGWMLQEWRVSIFAQELGTRKPISAQRIARYLKKAGAA